MTSHHGGEMKSVEVIKQAIETQIFNWEITPDQITRMQEISDIMSSQGILEKTVNVKDILDLTWQQQQKK
ncbi:hypothetical protein D3C73_1645220 [compost metagenome]